MCYGHETDRAIELVVAVGSRRSASSGPTSWLHGGATAATEQETACCITLVICTIGAWHRRKGWYN
jgi:hypothetical protein